MHTMHTYLSLLFSSIFAYYILLTTAAQLLTGNFIQHLQLPTFQEAFLNNTSSVFACQGVSYIYLLSLLMSICFFPLLKRERNNLSFLFSPPMYLQSNACIVWRRFANLFETSQSLFWASFGLVSLTDFELTGIKEFTRFWALLMFGSYSVCNIIVLLNMLIAMMSNSFQVRIHRVQVDYCEINCNP